MENEILHEERNQLILEKEPQSPNYTFTHCASYKRLSSIIKQNLHELSENKSETQKQYLKAEAMAFEYPKDKQKTKKSTLSSIVPPYPSRSIT